jgi:hypothetical protein
VLWRFPGGGDDIVIMLEAGGKPRNRAPDGLVTPRCATNDVSSPPRSRAACSHFGPGGSRCRPAMALPMIRSTNSASICSRENQRR